MCLLLEHLQSISSCNLRHTAAKKSFAVFVPVGPVGGAGVLHGVLPAEGVAGAKGVEEVHREPLLNLLVRVEQPIPPAGKLSSKF